MAIALTSQPWRRREACTEKPNLGFLLFLPSRRKEPVETILTEGGHPTSILRIKTASQMFGNRFLSVSKLRSKFDLLHSTSRSNFQRTRPKFDHSLPLNLFQGAPGVAWSVSVRPRRTLRPGTDCGRIVTCPGFPRLVIFLNPRFPGFTSAVWEESQDGDPHFGLVSAGKSRRHQLCC